MVLDNRQVKADIPRLKEPARAVVLVIRAADVALVGESQLILLRLTDPLDVADLYGADEGDLFQSDPIPHGGGIE